MAQIKENFSDRNWRIKQFQIEEERGGKNSGGGGEEGDEKLDAMIQSMNDYVMSLTTTLGSMPNYVNFIRKPNDASKTPEQNEIDHETVINALKNLQDNTELMNKMYNYFTKYIGEKYKFKG